MYSRNSIASDVYYMPKKRTANQYQRYIYTYEQRIKILREEFGYKYGKQMPAEYYERFRRMSQKIKKWREALRRQQANSQFNLDLDNAVMQFLDCPSVRDCSRPGRTTRDTLAVKLFYRWGLENAKAGIGRRLADYTGAVGDGTPGRNRKKFIREIQVREDYRTAWNNFKKFMELWKK